MKEFDVFRADIDTKDSLIDQLKERIGEVTRLHKAKDEKVKRNIEIDQLKDLINEMTTQLVSRDGVKKLS